MTNINSKSAPSVPEGWKLAPIEPTETMISEGSSRCCISEDCAKQCWKYMLAVAIRSSRVEKECDALPDGWKLAPIDPTEIMINEGSCASTLPGPRYISEDCAKQCWEYMLAVTPELKQTRTGRESKNMKVLNLENMLKMPKILTREMMGEAWAYIIEAAPDAMTTQDWKVYEVCDMDKAALSWACDVKYVLLSPVGHVFAYYDLVAV